MSIKLSPSTFGLLLALILETPCFAGVVVTQNVSPGATSLTPVVAWQNISTNAAGANGAWQFTDSNNTTNRFYRSYVG